MESERLESVTPEVLAAKIEAGRSPVILDVRSKREFDEGHVPGAIHMPFWRVGSRWHELAHRREDEIVVYCGHGPRAYMAGAALRRRGFARIVYLAGHMTKWKQRRLPLVTVLAALTAMPALAVDGQTLLITGEDYTKWLWGTQRNDGSVYNFGAALYLGGLGGIPLNRPIVGLAIR